MQKEVFFTPDEMQIIRVCLHNAPIPYDQGEGAKLLPYDWMNNSNMFYEYAIGLGAPYADKLSRLGDTDPPEDFGTICYDCL